MLAREIMRVGLGRAGGGMQHNLLLSVPGLRIINPKAHGIYDDYVKECRDLGVPVPPAFVFIRNPWQWYVSQWCWMRHVQRSDFLFKGSFRQAMEITRRDPSFWYLRTLTWSWFWHGADKVQYVGRFENLEDETVRILMAIIPDLTTERKIRTHVWADLEGRVRCPGGEFEDGSLDYRKYYDAELKRWVAEWDAELIERFHYEF